MTTPRSQGHAVDVLATPASQLYANLHPVLLLSLLVFGFRSLVNDPVSTLLAFAPTLALLQAAYCVICLPNSNTPAAAVASRPGQKKKAAKPAQDLAGKLVVCILPLRTVGSICALLTPVLP